jgi:hypothetical protein
MLCERCQQKEATVHLTLVVGPSVEPTTHDFCDSCYPAVEAEGVKAYNTQPNRPLPTDVEHITALELLEAQARAACNGADKPAVKHIYEELKRLPKTRQRLALELLQLAWNSLESGEEPIFTAFMAASFGDSMEAERIPEYIVWLERIINRCFELRSQLSGPEREHRGFELTLPAMLVSLGKVDRGRFTALLESLRGRCVETGHDARLKLLSDVEALVLRSENPAPDSPNLCEKC